jgi:hypothetical protein
MAQYGQMRGEPIMSRTKNDLEWKRGGGRQSSEAKEGTLDARSDRIITIIGSGNNLLGCKFEDSYNETQGKMTKLGIMGMHMGTLVTMIL